MGGRDASTYYKKAIVFDIESQECSEVVEQPTFSPPPLSEKPKSAAKPEEEENKAAKSAKVVTWQIEYATEPSQASQVGEDEDED